MILFVKIYFIVINTHNLLGYTKIQLLQFIIYFHCGVFSTNEVKEMIYFETNYLARNQNIYDMNVQEMNSQQKGSCLNSTSQEISNLGLQNSEVDGYQNV